MNRSLLPITVVCSRCGGEFQCVKKSAIRACFTGVCRPCINRKSATRHGAKGTLTYNSWKSMRNRVVNPKWNYIKKGITLCERWNSFENFLADMGERPSVKHSIDRINNNGNYEPGNCRWATPDVQANNTSRNVIVSAFGESKTLSQWLRDPRTNVGHWSLSKRLKNGVEPEAALTTPSRVLLYNPCTCAVEDGR